MFARRAKKAFVDIDPFELGKFQKQGMHVDLSICANVADVLKLLVKKIEKDIKFIYRNFNVDENLISEPSNWVLYRRDLDTW